MHSLILSSLIVFLLASGTVAAQHNDSIVEATDTPIGRVITRHEIRVAGNLIRYEATAGRLPIRDVATGEARGNMGYFAYRLPSPNNKRPVMFVWNGGPGSNSTWLHFFAAGPRRIEGESLTDNRDTWLTIADLVFVDPIGTGFSRPARREYAAEFYSTPGDVASVAEFVRSWLLTNDAQSRPVFLAGESWGAGRAAGVAYALLQRGQKVAGLVLISGSWGINKEYGSNDARTALNVVDMASAALFHQKLAADLGRDVVTVRRLAEEWVRTRYQPALANSQTLNDRERDDIVAGLSRFTGLAPDRIDRRTMVITPRQFRTELLKDQGKVANLLDLRSITTDLGTPGANEILRYLRRDLRLTTDLPYLGLEPATLGYAPLGNYPQSVNAQWDYATGPVSDAEREVAIAAAVKSGSGPPALGPPLPGTEEALALEPALRVLIANGLYDSYFGCASGSERLRSLPAALRSALQLRCYSGGHAMYFDSAARAELASDVRSFVGGVGKMLPAM
jgi:carboxypeptidase C (cathepsin A)